MLARPEGAGPGTKGLSLFMVPKFWPNPDGTPGEANGVEVTRLEDKLGLHASPTGDLALGQQRPARGVLVGDRHDGIRQMFRIIEYARMSFGLKPTAAASASYLLARDYAAERVQGPRLSDALDPTAARVAIIEHPDVRRSLLEQKAHVEGMRALVFYACELQDKIAAGDDSDALRRRNDLLLPLIKGHGADAGFASIVQSLQILGGAGYVRDWPVEQALRDTKIDSIYEGTTGIQALDLLFRKVLRDGGTTLSALLDEIDQFVAAGDEGLHFERRALGSSLEDVRAMQADIVGHLGRSVDVAASCAVGFLHALARLCVGWRLTEQATVAARALQTGALGSDDFFYRGKLAAVRTYALTSLPLSAATRITVRSADQLPLNVPKEVL